VLGHFEGQPDGWLAGRHVLFLIDFDRIVDVRQLAGRELHIHDRTDDLNDFACTHVVPLCSHAEEPGQGPSAGNPQHFQQLLFQRFGSATISINSLVLAACRILL
jgi:hypothetical protein